MIVRYTLNSMRIRFNLLFAWCLGGTMLLISCSQEVEIAEESFKIRVGSSALTFPSSKMWQSFENSNELLIGAYNLAQHTVDVYSSSKQLCAVKLQKHQIGDVKGLHCISTDSILVLAENIIYLLDTSGLLIKRFDSNSQLKDITLFNASGAYRNSIWNDRAKSIHLGIFNNDFKPFYHIFRYPIMAVFELGNTKIKETNIRYPAHLYNQNGWWHLIGLQPAITKLNNNLIAYTFPVSHWVYTIESDSKIDSFYFGSSKLKNYNFPYFNENKRGDRAYTTQYVATLGRYSSFVAASNEFMARVAIHPCLSTPKHACSPFEREESIIFYINGKLNEYQLTNKKYLSSIMFSHNNAIYLAKNYRNDTLPILEFSRFSVQN